MDKVKTTMEKRVFVTISPKEEMKKFDVKSTEIFG